MWTATVGDPFHHPEKPAQVNCILGESARAIDPCGDAERPSRADAPVAVEQAVAFEEVGSGEHGVHRHHTPGEESESRGGEPTHRPFGKHAQALLDFLVSGQPGREDRQALLRAIEAGEQMDADLVAQKRIDPPFADLGRSVDHQLRVRDEQSGDIAADLDQRVEGRDV